jgi:hypothetical protein
LRSGRAALYLCHCLVIGGSSGHADEEVILVFNQEDEHVLAEAILGWSHVVGGMRKDARLEDCGEIGRRHLVQVGLGSEYGKQVENVEQQLAVQGRELGDQLLVSFDGGINAEVANGRALAVHGSDCLRLVVSNWVPKAIVELQGYDGLGQLIEIASENVCSVMDGVAGPVESLAISIG